MEIKFDPTKVKIVKVDEVRANTWNPKDENTEDYEKIKRGIELKGQRLPIVVRENNGYEIIDGEQRWRACKELGFGKVIIYSEGEIPDKEAKELTIWYQQQVPFNEIELASLIKDLSQYPDLEIPYSLEEIEDFKNLAEFNWDQYKTGEPEFEEGVRTLSIKMSEGQYKIVIDAIDKVKKEIEMDCSDGRALELICGDYLSGK